MDPTSRNRRSRVLVGAVLILAAMLTGACSKAPQASPASAARAAIDVRTASVVGALYLPDTPGPHPGILVIGGSEGGTESSGRLASALADAGFVALAVGYFGMDGLPEQLVSIPLERFEGAIAWLRQRPEVRGEAIALLGASKGAEAALLVASAQTGLAAVVAATPTHVAWQGLDTAAWSDVPSWTHHGAPVPYVRYDNQGPFWPLVEMYTRSLRNLAAVAVARIPVAGIDAPLLLISGQKDQMWPAYAMSEDIARSVRGARPDAVVEHLSYVDAGHAVMGLPFDPDGPVGERLAALGGSPEGNLAARRDGWPKVLAFLHQHLDRPVQSSPPSSTKPAQ